MTMKDKAANLLLFLGALLVAGALTLYYINGREERQAAEIIETLLPQLIETVDNKGRDPSAAAEEQKEQPGAENTAMTEKVIDGNAYIGYLSIPILDLELPVLSDWSDERLKIAPCRYQGTLRGNDLVLMAHNYDRHFGRISQLQVGDLVVFRDMNGGETTYRMAAQDVLGPYETEEMTAGHYDLTLFTCTYGGKHRVTVYCNRI